METIGKIRRRGLRDGESISGLARSLQLSRIEASAPLVQAMAEGFASICRMGRNRFASATTRQDGRTTAQARGPGCGRLDAWLRGDGLLPKARRRTVLRRFECLQAEGYAGAYDSVQRPVRQWKIEAGRALSTKVRVGPRERRPLCRCSLRPAMWRNLTGAASLSCWAEPRRRSSWRISGWLTAVRCSLWPIRARREVTGA